ncbi:hypothetical protein H4217_008132 [Coemansia sp. RSA 1939]|nr:hypothetical protein H4217_008132 [Coemansia sp. RSA 1939]KAJ2606667.1 hypothetical protein EV177_005880 [Coemansia sp. RSA 1804]
MNDGETSSSSEQQHSTPVTISQSTAKAPRNGRGAKPHVPSACTNCKKAHLACDLQRPCRRCVNSGKCSTCKDVQHKKRGRPRSKDKKAMAGACEKSQMEGQMFQFSFTSPPSSSASSSTASGSSNKITQCSRTQHSTVSAPSALSLTSPVSPLSHAPSPAAATPVSAMTHSGAPASLEATAAALSHHRHHYNSSGSQSSLPPSPVPAPLFRDAAAPKYPTASRAQAPLSLLSSAAEESAAAASCSSTTSSYLFLTPSLLCLRLEELSRASGNTLLGFSLLSLINRNVMDFVSEHDKHSVLGAFELIRHKLSSRLAQSPSRVYSHAVLGHPPPAVDPNTFQALPVDRLLQRVCADVSGNVRAHLRTAAGCYDLFDIHVYVGAVSRPPSASAARGAVCLTLDEVYFVCRITKFDALNAASASSPLAVPRAVPQPSMLCGSICKNSFEDQSRCELPSAASSEYCHQAKRHRAAEMPASPNALYLLAAVTDSSSTIGGASCSNASDKQSSASSKHSTVSSPTLMTPSPSLVASVPPRVVGKLPPLSDLLKLLDSTDKPQQQQQQQKQHYSLPPTFHAKSFISL